MIRSDPRRAIAYKIVYVFLATLMLAMVKSIDRMPVTEIIFFRCLLTVLPLSIYLMLRGELTPAMKTQRPFGHMIRAVLSLTSMCLTYFAVRMLPLPEAVTLQYTQPLFVVALSAVILGDRLQLSRWLAVIVGFIGAFVVTFPKLTIFAAGSGSTSTAEIIGAGAALASAAVLALNFISIRQLVQTESSPTITLWWGIYCSVILLFTAPWGWVLPVCRQLLLLVLIGVIGAVVQLMINESMRYAPPSTTAPFEYSSLIFSVIIGFIAFGDVADGYTITGGAILIVAGLLIVWNERGR